MANVVIQQVEPDDYELAEEWVRVTDEKDIFGVCATRARDGGEWPWQVGIYVAEFIRKEPLQSQLHNAITDALSRVPGVTRAGQQDREVWALQVQGEVSGEALVRAASAALERLSEQLRAAYAALQEEAE